MAKKKSMDVESLLKMMTANFICPCPECGCTDTKYEMVHEGTPFPHRMYVDCPHCGRSTIVSNTKDRRWRTEKDGVLYIPDADNISVTEYHRFNPEIYGTEEEAIRSEMKLLDKCMETYRVLRIDWEIKELMNRGAELYVRAFELGMRDYVTGSILYTVSKSIFDGGEMGMDDIVDKSIAMLDGSSVEELSIIYITMSGFAEDEPKLKRLAEHARRMILDEVESDPNVEKCICAFKALDGAGDQAAREVIDAGIAKAKSIDDENQRVADLVALYHCSILKLGKGTRLDEEVEFVRIHRDEFEWEYLDVTIDYGTKMSDEPEKHEKILEMVNYAIEFVNAQDEADYNGDMDYDMSQLLHIRYAVTNDVRNLIDAAEYALASVSITGDKDSERLFFDCVNDANMPKKDGARLKKNGKRLGLM